MFLQIGEREKINEDYYQKDPFYNVGLSTPRIMPGKATPMSLFVGRLISALGLLLLFLTIFINALEH